MHVIHAECLILARQPQSGYVAHSHTYGGYLLAPMIVFVTRGDWDWLAQSVAEHAQTAAAVVRLRSAAPVASPHIRHPAVHRPGAGADSEHLAEYPCARAPLLLP